jgi:serine/threonine protein kinase
MALNRIMEPIQLFDFETIEREFGRVIGVKDISAPRGIIKALNQNLPSGDSFIRFASLLPSLKLDVDTGAIKFYKKGTMNRIRKTPVGTGAFGTIYKSHDESTIYKRITLIGDSDIEIEEKSREIFLETFIQVVLSCDPTYGNSVCKIKGLYRAPTSELMRKTRGEKAAALASDPSITLYILMEPLHCNMWKMQEELRKRLGRKIGLQEFLPVMSDIANVLDHFKKVYGFSHRDLHGGNIMFASETYNEPKLIDFGLSCLTLNGVTYSFVRENVFETLLFDKPCNSYDLLILASSLYEYEKPNLGNDCLEFLCQSSRGANDKLLIDDLPSFTHIYNPSAKFHMVYPDRILDTDGELYESMSPYMPLKYMETDAFIAFIQRVQTQLDTGAVHYDGGARRRRRTFRYRNGRKRRRTYRHFRC